MNTRPICILPGNGTLSFTKKEKAPFAPLCMRKKAELYLKFTQKKSFRQEKLPFSCLKIEVSLSSGSYFYNRKLLLQFTFFVFFYFELTCKFKFHPSVEFKFASEFSIPLFTILLKLYGQK